MENRINYNNTFGKRVAMKPPSNIGGDLTDNRMDVESSKYIKVYIFVFCNILKVKTT